MTKCLLRLASTSILGTLTFATACRGSSRRQEKQDYSILDFRFWITEEACNVGKLYQD